MENGPFIDGLPGFTHNNGLPNLHLLGSTKLLGELVGLVGKILTGNPWVLTIQIYRGFRLKFSHHPIL